MADTLNTGALDRAVADHLVTRMEQLRDDIREAINRMGLKASGATGRSLTVRVSSGEVSLWGRRFFAGLQYGSQPWRGVTGIKCSFDEFRYIIREWAQAKGLSFGSAKEHNRVIGAIAATIIRKGSKLYRQGAYRDVYDTLIAQAVKDMGVIVLDKVGTTFDIEINKWVRRSVTINI